MPKSKLDDIFFKKLISCFLLILMFSNTFSQLKNFGTNAKFKPEPNYFFSVYVYADLVREGGFGIQYQLNNKYNIDFSAYLINPNTYFKDIIKQWDYYDLKGYGFSLKPKFQFSKLSRLYVGLNLAYEKLYHDKVWVEYYNGKGSEIHKNLEETDGYGYTVGFTFGNKLAFKKLFLEPFFGLGLTSTMLNKMVYETNSSRYYHTPINYPYSSKVKYVFFQMNIGLKLGFSFKKSKKHAAIDKKFDDVYIPKANNLNNYIKTIDYKNPKTKKDLKRALTRYEGLNRNVLTAYRRYYRDTTTFYNKIDSIFIRIDRLIIKGNQ